MIHIVREEKGEDRDYTYISTGNFHEGTAKIYSDVSLLTSSRELAREVGMVFNFIERPYIPLKLKHLLLSPIYMRDQLSDLIRFEMDQAMVGHKAYIRIKLNSLLDESMIQLMYEASSCGVKIDLNVRGICALIPGVKGLSENIRAISIVDKYLEHTRIFIFHHGGENLTFISSADWMQRNLDMRVEIAAPIYDQDLKAELSDFFNLQWNDNQKARIFDAGNSDKHVKSSGKAVRSQEDFYIYLEKKGKKG
jgi:polyphosphate kinase